MLHIVRNSPFESRVLDECLALMAETDRLLLLQDGVIAFLSAVGLTAIVWLAAGAGMTEAGAAHWGRLAFIGLVPTFGSALA